MARLARAEVFNPNEVAILHVIGRVVRRCFLLGNDPVTGKNYDHRKIWIEDQLKHLAANFGIDLLSFAILSNHFHLIAQLKIGTNGLKQSGVSPFDATRVLSQPNRSEDERSRPDRA